MDLLGTEGEKASEAIQNLSNRIEDLETHLNAVDSAVQDTQNESRKKGSEVAEENRRRLVQIEEFMKQLADVQRTTLKEIESEKSRNSRYKSKFESKLNALETKVRKTRESQEELESIVETVEKKVFRIEDGLAEEIESNQDRIESKVSESTHKEEFDDLKKEISRLKASVNALADDVNDEKIRVE